MSKLKESMDAHQSLTKKSKIELSNIDYNKAESYKPMLEMLDSLNTSMIVVVDYYTGKYFFVSKEINSRLGFHKNKFPDRDQYWYFSRIHPEDYFVGEAGVMAKQFVLNDTSPDPKNYKLTSEFRLLNDNNEWVRITSQSSILELDSLGNVWLVLHIWDLSPSQDTERPGLVTFRTLKDHAIIFSLEGKESADEIDITKREKQVLALVAKGYRSKEIAEQLFISVNTVNNHRRNIMNKLNASNSTEAVSMAKSLGLV
jgi:DNA-binding CsgD family transcriptional regulator